MPFPGDYTGRGGAVPHYPSKTSKDSTSYQVVDQAEIELLSRLDIMPEDSLDAPRAYLVVQVIRNQRHRAGSEILLLGNRSPVQIRLEDILRVNARFQDLSQQEYRL